MTDLTNIQRNRMLYQRESFWNAERKAARAVLDILNTDNGYRIAMNVLANFIIMNILLWGNESDRTTRDQVAFALQQEKGLTIWGDADATLATLLIWLARGRKWQVEETSEFFRLFVAVVENIYSKIDTAKGLKMIKVQSSNFRFVAEDVDELKRFSSEYELIDLSVTDFKQLNSAMGSVKNRELNHVRFFDKTMNGNTIEPKKPRSRLSLADTYQRIISLSDHDVSSKRRIARMLTNSSGGTNIHTLKPNSLIGTVEWIYGLASGADTSGTTAEIIALCRLFEDYLPKTEMDSLTSGVSWYLGPVLSMIKNGHHTLLESAVAITLGERTGNEGEYQWPVKYVPGIYSRLLMPANPNFISRELYKKVYDCLALYELKGDDNIYIYQPTKGAWSDSDSANVSLVGGTIINNYSYVARSGEQIAQYDLPAMLGGISFYLNANADTDELSVMIDKIYSLIKKETSSSTI